jgi:hypothetical protein
MCLEKLNAETVILPEAVSLREDSCAAWT